MTQAGTSRGRKIAFALVAALVAAVGLYRWTGPNEPPASQPYVVASSPGAMGARREPVRVAVSPASRPSPRNAQKPHSVPDAPLPAEPSSGARPTPSGFDLATIAP